MIGFRVFDVGLLVLFLVWFFRLRDDEDDADDDGPGGGPKPAPPDGPGGGGLRLPLGPVRAANTRLRDHSRPVRRVSRRGAEPVPRPLPARVRRPRSPARAPRAVLREPVRH
jgi:hypothetical protein